MKKKFSMGIVLSLLIFSLNSCKKNNQANMSGIAKNDINLATNATLGQYLTNKQGLTLYMFADDADSTSSCTGGCESIWPPFTADLSTAKLDAGLSVADFATITTASGIKQVTYKGWPLYTFSPSGTDNNGNTINKPEVVGSTKGDGVGGVWFIAKPDYTIMLANKQLTGLDGNNYKSDYSLGTGNTVYFTDGTGRTLYTFALDSFNINKFTKADFSNNAVFPIYEQNQIVVPSILDKTLFGSITVAGKTQMTYKGWPLYFFGQDTERGSNKGVSVPHPGIWPVAVKDIPEASR
jgi:predicted lipoprotein with Yx(FWY)xxD motif